jgi:transcriptional regulator with XRE-family HTH domain
MTAINPHRITIALDRAKLFGPTADAKVGAVEPDLDNWEAGRSQPTPAQLEKLARLANVPLGFFTLPDDAEPQLSFARLCFGRGRGQTLIQMRGEPVGVPQGSLFDEAGS